MKFITKLRQARRLSYKRKYYSAADKEHEFCNTLDDNSEKQSVLCQMSERKISLITVDQLK